MSYIDGFILPIRDDKLAEYTPIAETFARKAKALGAIGSMEAIGDGLEHGHTTDFYKSVHAEEGENVIFSIVIWLDKPTDDNGWEKIMADPEGSFIWYELMSPDPDASKTFYDAVVGWDIRGRSPRASCSKAIATPTRQWPSACSMR